MPRRVRGESLLLAAVLGVNPIAGFTQQAPLLPPAPKELANRPTNIVLWLAKDGTPTINNQSITWARLPAELHAIFGQRPEKILFMKTSAQDRAADVRHVVAIARKQGVRVFGLPG